MRGRKATTAMTAAISSRMLNPKPVGLWRDMRLPPDVPGTADKLGRATSLLTWVCLARRMPNSREYRGFPPLAAISQAKRPAVAVG
jgi:hypothetical protein